MPTGRPTRTPTLPSRTTVAFLVRYYVEVLSVFFILLVLQTGLVPFSATLPKGATGSNDLFRFDSAAFPLPDIISNIFLYIPVGTLLYWCAFRAFRRGTSALLVTIGLSAALSGGIEWIQAFLPARISSVTDFVSNLTGAGLGVCIAWFGRALGPRLFSAVIVEFRQQPLAAAIKAYCCALVFTAVIPFSFSMDPGLLKRSLKQSHFVPFESVRILHQEAEEAMVGGNYRQFVDASWREARCWSRWAAEAASFAVLAWFVLVLLHGQYGFSPGASLGLMAWFCGMLALTLSVAQIPILTRSVDGTDVVFRFVGVALGAVARSLHRARSVRLPSADWPRYTRRLAWWGCSAVTLYIVATGLMPFLFDAGPEGPHRSFASLYALPFFGYFETRFDLMIADVLQKLTAYSLFAVLLVSYSERLQAYPIGKRILYVTFVGICMATAIEIAQMYIVVRIASLTDLILASGGCLAGVVGREQVIAFCKYAMSCEDASADPMPRQAIMSSPPRTTDALIGTLLDPNPDAPAEPSPPPPAPLRKGGKEGEARLR